jgi:hypothetical protein
MWFAATCHTEMVIRLAALWAAVSLAVQSVLGLLPTEAFQTDVVGEVLANF